MIRFTEQQLVNKSYISKEEVEKWICLGHESLEDHLISISEE